MSIIAEKDCGRIQLSAGSNVYEFFLSGSNTGPGKPVWKLKDKDLSDFYIFNSGTKHGLMVGNVESLKSGEGLKSKNYTYFFLI